MNYFGFDGRSIHTNICDNESTKSNVKLPAYIPNGSSNSIEDVHWVVYLGLVNFGVRYFYLQFFSLISFMKFYKISKWIMQENHSHRFSFHLVVCQIMLNLLVCVPASLSFHSENSFQHFSEESFSDNVSTALLMWKRLNSFLGFEGCLNRM